MSSDVLEIFDVETIRKDFPILTTRLYNNPLVYFDNAATTQKPLPVLKALDEYYKHSNSNVHRGVHQLSQQATDAYETARKKIAAFINSKYSHEIIFTKGTTDGINLIASSFGKKFIHKGDIILISAMEHHSNIVPWQLICEEKEAVLKIIPMNENGELLMDEFEKLLNEKVKFISVTYVSNTLGTINPVKKIIAAAHQNNIPVLLDAAQAVQHIPIDVQELDADFLAFSSHKIYGPTGIGILYGKEEWLSKLPPYQGGGDMIETVTFAKTTYNKLPYKFEAGTPHIAGAVGLGAAIEYFTKLDLEKVREHEQELLQYATSELQQIKGLRIIGTAKQKTSSLSFIIDKLHPYDVGELLDKQGIAVRTGHHCTQPIMDFYKIPGTVRASFALYNTMEEIDRLVKGLNKSIALLK